MRAIMSPAAAASSLSGHAPDMVGIHMRSERYEGEHSFRMPKGSYD